MGHTATEDKAQLGRGPNPKTKSEERKLAPGPHPGTPQEMSPDSSVAPSAVLVCLGRESHYTFPFMGVFHFHCEFIS